MHKTKLEYFKSNWCNEAKCFSALTMVPINNIIVGTPIIVISMPILTKDNTNQSSWKLDAEYSTLPLKRAKRLGRPRDIRQRDIRQEESRMPDDAPPERNIAAEVHQWGHRDVGQMVTEEIGHWNRMPDDAPPERNIVAPQGGVVRLSEAVEEVNDNDRSVVGVEYNRHNPYDWPPRQELHEDPNNVLSYADLAARGDYIHGNITVATDDIEEPTTTVTKHRPLSESLKKYTRTEPRSKMITKGAREEISAKALYNMGVEAANKVLQDNPYKANGILLFGNGGNYKDFEPLRLPSSNVYFDGRKPLIFDVGHRFELERLNDVYKKDELNNFSSIVEKLLTASRYLNYTFAGVAASNKKHMIADLNTIFSNLGHAYPENVSFFHSTSGSGGDLRCLVDVVSISFYRLEDVISIFDYKRLSGVVVEVFLTNSVNTSDVLNIDGMCSTYRFIFSKHRENVFTIDGDPIKRPYDSRTSDMLRTIVYVLDKHVPNDEKPKDEKPNKYKKNKSKKTSV